MPDEPERTSRVEELLQKGRTSTAVGGLIALLAAVALWRNARPSNNRRWVREQEHLPTVRFEGDRVVIQDFRCFTWESDAPPICRYETRTADLNKIKSLDFIVSYFGTGRLAGHTLLSFGFEDGEYVAISVEIRRTEGQHYGFFRGLFRSYELMYVIAHERDIVRVRTNIRKERVYLYPVNAPVEAIKKLFLSMLTRAQKLALEPEFYHSVKNSCTTNLIKHFNETGLCRTAEHGPRAVFSGLSDALLHDLGLIGEGGELKEIRPYHRISAKARAYGDGPQFSQKIRETIPSSSE